jgi:hypothetical protein
MPHRRVRLEISTDSYDNDVVIMCRVYLAEPSCDFNIYHSEANCECDPLAETRIG